MLPFVSALSIVNISQRLSCHLSSVRIIHHSLHPELFSTPLYLFLPLRLAFTLSKLFCLSLQVSLSVSLFFDLSEKRNIKEPLFPLSGALSHFPSSFSCPLLSFTTLLHPLLSYAHSFFSPILCLVSSLAVVPKFWHCAPRRTCAQRILGSHSLSHQSGICSIQNSCQLNNKLK